MEKMIKKFELIDVEDNHNGNKVYQIKALRDFEDVSEGDLGGYVENEKNLSHLGNCWIYNNARVLGNARVYEDAQVFSNAMVFDNAEVFGNAKVHGSADVYQRGKVYGNASVYGNARVYNSAEVFGNAIVHGNARIKSRTKVSRPVTVIDNSEVTITITDDQIHVYQSTVYEIDNIPDKYIGVHDLIKNTKK